MPTQSKVTRHVIIISGTQAHKNYIGYRKATQAKVGREQDLQKLLIEKSTKSQLHNVRQKAQPREALVGTQQCVGTISNAII